MRVSNKGLYNGEESSGAADGWEVGDGWRECKTSREAALKTVSRMHKRSVKAALST